MSERLYIRMPGGFAAASFVKQAFLLGVIGLLFAGCAAGPVNNLAVSHEQAAQRQAVDNFYVRVVALNIQGLPNRGDLAQLTP